MPPLVLARPRPIRVSQAAVTNDEGLLASINVGVYPDGQAVNLEALFGNSMTFNDDGEVVEAAAMSEVTSARMDSQFSEWGQDRVTASASGHVTDTSNTDSTCGHYGVACIFYVLRLVCREGPEGPSPGQCILAD